VEKTPEGNYTPKGRKAGKTRIEHQKVEPRPKKRPECEAQARVK